MQMKRVVKSPIIHTYLINWCQKGMVGKTLCIIQHHKYMSTVIASVGQTKYLG